MNIGLEREPIADSLKSRRLSADTDTEGHFGRSLVARRVRGKDTVACVGLKGTVACSGRLVVYCRIGSVGW